MNMIGLDKVVFFFLVSAHSIYLVIFRKFHYEVLDLKQSSFSIGLDMWDVNTIHVHYFFLE